MIDDNIFQSIFWSSIPLLIGNFFQQLYNTVNSYVVENFVNTNTLVTVRASTPVTNMPMGFFMSLSTGAGVVISQYFGAGQGEAMSRAVHSAMAFTGLLSVVSTRLGLLYIRPLLRAIGMPEDILPHSSLYLMIYFCGITFSFFCNMGSGILRAVGDSRHPLLYLVVASIVNIILDFTFVCGFHMGIAGVAITTIMAQVVSSFMVMHKLMHAREGYKAEIRKIRFYKKMIHKIIAFGSPAACQRSITSFSNVVMQSHINWFETVTMAGYSATLRIDGFLQLPFQSFNVAIATSVGQNIRIRKYKRVKGGISAAQVMSSLIILTGLVGVYFEAPLLISMFTNSPQVIGNGSSMLHVFSRAYTVIPVIQVLNDTLHGAGLSKVLMFFMLGSFVVLGQIYLLVAVPMTHSLMVVMTGWPITQVIRVTGVFLYYVKAD